MAVDRPAPRCAGPGAKRAIETASVCVVGSGYVGTVVAASLADIGHSVAALEIDTAKLASLRSGHPPFHEPGLDELLGRALERGSLSFTDDPERAVGPADVVFLCVGSPSHPDGSVNLRPIEAACQAIARWLGPDDVVVIKSTVPVGTNARIGALMTRATALGSRQPRSVVSNPEFLRQGSAVEDFLHPDRIVIGGEDEVALDAVADVYRPILEQRFSGADGRRAPVLVRTSPVAAEAAKYAANAFLATKVSFINEMANVCDLLGADIEEVATIIGLDHRVGPAFLQAGLGWGGSCFSKDIDALVWSAQELGYDAQLLRSVRDVNRRQLETVIAKLRRHLNLSNARVTLLGLAFKPGTGDLRGAPAVQLARILQCGGAHVTAFDPVVRVVGNMPDIAVTDDPYDAAAGADAIVVVTDWPELRALDLTRLRRRMQGDVLVDGRNVLDPLAATRAGLSYEGIGRALARESQLDATRARDPRGARKGRMVAHHDPALEAVRASREVNGNGQDAAERSPRNANDNGPNVVFPDRVM